MVPVSLEEVINNSLIFLGAGASYDAGCFLSSKMLIDLKDSITAVDIPEKNIFLDIYNFINASLLYQYNLDDIESSNNLNLNIEDFVRILNIIIERSNFIPYPIVGNWNEKIISWESKIPNIFFRFKEFIEKLLIEKWLRFECLDAQTLLNPINELLSIDEDFQLNIFTLNYDLTFESVINNDKADIVLADGFEGKDWNSSFNKKINYFKLHGSLNWYFDQQTESIQKNMDNDITLRPTIIFGNDNKMISFDPFLQLLNIFKEKLSSSRLIIVIGYSFQDKYINNLIIQKLMNRKYNKKLIVVDPGFSDKNALINRIKLIQSRKNLDEIINFTKISEEFVDLFKMPAKEFYGFFFENGGKNIKEKYIVVKGEDNVF